MEITSYERAMRKRSYGDWEPRPSQAIRLAKTKGGGKGRAVRQKDVRAWKIQVAKEQCGRGLAKTESDGQDRLSRRRGLAKIKGGGKGRASTSERC